MMQKDWIMRQVELVSISIGTTFLNKERPQYELEVFDIYTDNDQLHAQLLELLTLGKINEAEELLFDAMTTYDTKILEVALDFYGKLNEYDDDFLNQCNFSRSEIADGLQEVKIFFGVE